MAATEQPKIFKKYEIVEGGGHHGGGWKVAYADFMTAMMAFFLLMWILASSDEQKLRGIAEYFTNATMPGGSGVLDGATLGPPGTLSASNGSVVARGSELGKIDDPSPAKWEIRDTTPTADPKEKKPGTNEGEHENPASADAMKKYDKPGTAAKEGDNITGSGGDGDAEHAEDNKKFEELQNEILQAMQANPDLDPLTQNVIFEQTPEGLHIQIIDQEGRPMFNSGRAEMAGATETLMGNLGKSLSALPNRIVLSGHTDAVRFSNSQAYDNWDLSSDRANATRRVFEASGVSRDRIIRVSGMADTQLLVPQSPNDPSNRRISIMVQYRTDAQMAQKMEPAKEPMENTDGMPSKDASIMPEKKPEQHVEQHAADHTAPAAVPLNDQVFLNLRNALR